MSYSSIISKVNTEKQNKEINETNIDHTKTLSNEENKQKELIDEYNYKKKLKEDKQNRYKHKQATENLTISSWHAVNPCLQLFAI